MDFHSLKAKLKHWPDRFPSPVQAQLAVLPGRSWVYSSCKALKGKSSFLRDQAPEGLIRFFIRAINLTPAELICFSCLMLLQG
jgi:hypothetical protein